MVHCSFFPGEDEEKKNMTDFVNENYGSCEGQRVDLVLSQLSCIVTALTIKSMLNVDSLVHRSCVRYTVYLQLKVCKALCNDLFNHCCVKL